MVRASHKWPGRDVIEAQSQRHLAHLIELGRRHESRHLRMTFSGSQILADAHDSRARLAKIAERRLHLVPPLAQAQHQCRLDGHPAVRS